MLNVRFVEERSRLGFASANALATAVGASQVAVKRIEDGQSVPGGEMLAAFADLGADIGYVLSGRRSGLIDVNSLGIAEAALRSAYISYRRVEECPRAVRPRLIALVYNQLAGKLKPTDDYASQALTAAAMLVESLADVGDAEMLERNLFVTLPEPATSAGVTVTGDSNRVAGRDMIGGAPPKGRKR